MMVKQQADGRPAASEPASLAGDTANGSGGPIQQEDSYEEEQDERKMFRPVRSQEQMIHLLPEKNPSFGMKEREASLSCRFIRDKTQGGDKWRTIGHGGERVSHPDLVQAALHQGHDARRSTDTKSPATPLGQESNGNGGATSNGQPPRRHRGKTAQQRVSPTLLRRTNELFDRVVKLLDDSLLSMMGPLTSWLLSVMHGLPRATCNVIFEKDLRLPILNEKGQEIVSLSFMALHPRNFLRKKYPTILVRNPYGRLTFFSHFYLFAERGYNVLVIDVRGRGESTGIFDCITDHDDGQATLDWVTSQPWFSPEHGVGLVGLSYNGFVCWSTFSKGIVHPAVRAIAPVNTTSRLSSINYRDGPLHMELTLRWAGYLWTLTRDTTSLVKLLLSLLHGLKFLGYLGIMDHPALIRARLRLPIDSILESVTGVRLNRFSMFTNAPDSPWAAERSAAPALRGDLPPALILGSWYDIFLPDTFHDFLTITERGAKHARLVVSADTHIGRYFAYGDVVRCVLPHFRRFLRPQALPYERDDDRVKVEILHSVRGRQWVGMPSWPPPTAEDNTIMLSADGRLCRGEALDVVTQGVRKYVYTPTDPTPSIGGNGIGFLDAGGRSQGRLEKRNGKDLLVYTSEPLQEDVFIMGEARLVLWVRCLSGGAVSADFVGRLCDVSRNGKSINICDGIHRVDFSESPRDDRGAFRVEVKLYPTAVRFAKGHRIRLHVASAGFWRWERNILCYGYESLIPVRFEILHGGAEGEEASCSQLHVPLVSKGDLKFVPRP